MFFKIVQLLAITSFFVTYLFAGQYRESPMLKAKVDSGILPSVEKRLPKEPFVVGQGVMMEDKYLDFEIGKYGGTLRMVHDRVGWNPDTFIMGVEPLLSAPTGDISTTGIRGNILHSFKVSDDKKVFTFKMREGLKWSDGVPVTMDDVLFAYEDCLMNEQITPNIPSWLRSAGKKAGDPMKLQILGHWTFMVSFNESYGGFLAELAISQWKGFNYMLKPKHYMKQFHNKYTPMKDLEPLIKEAGFKKGEWDKLFKKKNFNRTTFFRPQGLGIPSLAPWILTKFKNDTMFFERNPYYFKVDEAGNQLPYIDKIRDDKTADTEMSNLKVITGEVDYLREGGSLVNLPLYKENEKKSGFRAVLYKWVSTNVLYLNPTYDDPVWRKLAGNVKFRKALNMSIDRNEIIEAVSYGFAELPTIVPNNFDLDKANKILDELGLDRRDSDGWRLRPDGKRLVIYLENSQRHPDFVPTIELIGQHWKKIGIDLNAKTVGTALRNQRNKANELMATMEAAHVNIWRTGHGFYGDYLPRYNWGIPWDNWYMSDGAKGEEPPADIKKLYKLNEQLKGSTPNSSEANRILDELFSQLYDNVYFFVVVEKIRKTQLVSARLGNIPTDGHSVGVNYTVEQMFFRE